MHSTSLHSLPPPAFSFSPPYLYCSPLPSYSLSSPNTQKHKKNRENKTSTMSLLSINQPPSSSTQEKFSCYFEAWLKQLEANLQHLVLGRQTDYESVLAILTAHHKDFYTAKWAAAHEDVLAFYSPQWLTPLEGAFLWFTGWKPSTTFRLVDSLRRSRAPITSLAQLTEAQVQKIHDLRAKIKLEEEKVEREMERQQVALGDRKMVGLARLASRALDSGHDSVASLGSVKGLMDGLEKVMKTADYVRLKTLKGLLDVLSAKQGVDFLAMFAMLQIQMRKCGKKRAAASTSGGIITALSMIN